MTKRHGYALLSALAALVVILSGVIYVTTRHDHGTPSGTVADNGPHRGTGVAPASAGTWVGAWATAPSGVEPDTATTGTAGRSVRNVVHVSIGGTSARITLSNVYGQSPLTIAHASLAISAGHDTAAARAETMRRLTFGGATSVVIPAGGQVVSDAARVNIPQDTDVLVTTYSPTSSGPVTYHKSARQTSYIAEGDRTEDATGTPFDEQTPFWRYLTALDVINHDTNGTVVVLGDSITDGITSTVDANLRWTDVLAQRLRAAGQSGEDVPRYSVVNEGISGNQVLVGGLQRAADSPSGISRFDRDVLGRPNAKVVVVELGINDILRNPRLADPYKITDGLRVLVRQAHARGLKVVGATLMPLGGHKKWTSAREIVREQVNAEIRAGKVFDAVVDLDAALRDPYAPHKLRPEYDSGDHLHPSDLGFRKMAETFDLRLLKGAGQAEL